MPDEKIIAHIYRAIAPYTKADFREETAKAALRAVREGQKYLVWSNEHNAWWMPNSRGYCENITSAGRYSFDEALKICNGANYDWDTESKRPNELPIAESIAVLMNAQNRKLPTPPKE